MENRQLAIAVIAVIILIIVIGGLIWYSYGCGQTLPSSGPSHTVEFKIKDYQDVLLKYYPGMIRLYLVELFTDFQDQQVLLTNLKAKWLAGCTAYFEDEETARHATKLWLGKTKLLSKYHHGEIDYNTLLKRDGQLNEQLLELYTIDRLGEACGSEQDSKIRDMFLETLNHGSVLVISQYHNLRDGQYQDSWDDHFDHVKNCGKLLELSILVLVASKLPGGVCEALTVLGYN